MKFTWIVIILSVLLSAVATSARADFIGLKIGANQWTPELSGSFSSGLDSSIDLLGDLGIDDPSSSSIQLILEHPIPLLPNVKYQGFDLDSRGSNLLTGSITFETQTYTNETISSTFDLSHDDIVLYYELLDNWINLDFGLDLKRFDGEVSVVGDVNTTPSTILIDETIPLLYLSARFDLPFSGFYIGADINNLSLGDSSVVAEKDSSAILILSEFDSS